MEWRDRVAKSSAWMSPDAMERPEGRGAGDSKAQPLVNAQGVSVLGADVEKGTQLEIRMMPHEVKHQSASVAFARVAGVSADAADFMITGDAQPFASHGD